MASRLYHTVANKIMELIDTGVFPPGTRLPGERDLAEKFGVSRVSVREAEIALQAQGRLEIKVGSGVYVTENNASPNANLPSVGAFELTEARALFEAEAAALAAPIISDETIEELESYLAIMSGKKKGDITGDEADEAFHQTIARATDNAAIVHIVDNLWQMRRQASKVQNIYRNVCDKDNSSREAEHQAILDALKNRDSSAARIAMRAHFTRMIEALLEASEEEAYEQVRRKASESRSRFLLTKSLS